MTKVKRVLTGAFALVMASSIFTACGSDDSSTANSTAATTTKPTGTTKAGETTTAPEATTTVANVVSGDADAADAFFVWSWNTDIQKILDGPFKADHPDLYKRIVYVNTGGTDTYQIKLDAMLADTNNKQYPDLIGLEADYIQKYTAEDKYTLPIADLGITDADTANEYQYTKDIATAYGTLKALSWQACPGAWTVRKSLCEEYLGTGDPAKIQESFASWDKVLETAEKVNTASKGATKLLAGTDDVFRVYMAAREQAWVDDNNVLKIDPTMEAYMDFAKSLYSKELTYNTKQWSTEWGAKKSDGSDEVLAWPGCTWFTYWCLDPKSYGDYLLIQGPQEYYWGGTWLAATTNTSDKEMAATIIKYFTCETDSMKKINALNSDYINNKAAVQEIIDAGGGIATGNTAAADKDPVMVDILADKQNFLQFFLPLADKIDVTTTTPFDSTINAAFNTQVTEYAIGNKDKETALHDFKSAVLDANKSITAE
ncbi:MAG: ABC transporter substrate-binding protein [Oscillospiraceae bacterium]